MLWRFMWFFGAFFSPPNQFVVLGFILWRIAPHNGLCVGNTDVCLLPVQTNPHQSLIH